MLLHVVRETDRGIVVRGAKYETAAAYANQAFVEADDRQLGRRRAVRLRGRASSATSARRASSTSAAPASPAAHAAGGLPAARTASTRSTRWSSSTTSRSRGRTCSSTATRAPPPSSARRCTATAPSPTRSASCACADMLIGAALLNVRQTGLEKQQAVQEKLAELACYREGINAHLTAAIAHGGGEPGRPADAEPVAAVHRPRAGHVAACRALMHIARELCGGQICVTPDAATFADPETGPWLEKFYTINERLGGRGPPQAARLRPRPAQLRLRRPPADLPALRPVAAVRPPAARSTATSTGTSRCGWCRSPPGSRSACQPRRTVAPARSWRERLG